LHPHKQNISTHTPHTHIQHKTLCFVVLGRPGDAAKSVDFFEAERVRGVPFCFGGLGGDFAGGVLFAARAKEAVEVEEEEEEKEEAEEEETEVGVKGAGLIAEVAQNSSGALVVVKFEIVANVSVDATIADLRRPA